jgi:hypothetical protein
MCTSITFYIIPNIYIFFIYRAPTGKFSHFLRKLGAILRLLYSCKSEFFICGDFNINYLTDTHRKNQLNSLLILYNLFSMVDFPTSVQSSSFSAIDNIFFDYSRWGNYEIPPLRNGLSDHDAKLILIYNVEFYKLTYNILNVTKINKISLAEFNYNLRFVTWELIFEDNDVNYMFSSFLNTFLQLFYANFPKIKNILH